MTIQLVTGQNMPWPHPRLRVEVQHTGGDLSALLLGPDEKVRSSADLVFYNQSAGEGVRWSAGPPQVLDLDLAILPVERVLCLVSVGPEAPALGGGPAPKVLLRDQDGSVTAEFVPVGLSTERALIAAEVYRRDGRWKVRAVGQGYEGGLVQAVTLHGVEVDDPPAQAPAPAYRQEVHAPAPPTTSTSASASEPQPPGTTPQDRLVQQSAAILEDASRSTASLRSTASYAERRLEHVLEQLVADPATRHGAMADTARAAAQREHDSMLETAHANHRRDTDHLLAELTGLERTLPPSMAAWGSDVWTRWGGPVHEHSIGLRVGELFIEDVPRLRMPMLLRLPLVRPLWVDTSQVGDPAGAAMLRTLVVRMLAGYPAGSVSVRSVELGGARSASLAPLGGPGCQVLSEPPASDPNALGSLLDDMVRQLDLIEMAHHSRMGSAEESIEGLDLRDRILVVHDFPTGFDDRTLGLLRYLAEGGARLGLQILLTCATSEAVPHGPLVSSLLRGCARVPADSGEVMVDGFGGTSWEFAPDLGPDDPSTLDRVLTRLAHG